MSNVIQFNQYKAAKEYQDYLEEKSKKEREDKYRSVRVLYEQGIIPSRVAIMWTEMIRNGQV